MRTSDTEKYIGLVKWFHDEARDANYGFIQHAKLGDLFFHERSIEQGQNINTFKENAIVVFTVQESKRHKGKLEAIDVKYLDTETDLNFLFNHFLSILTEKGKYSDYNTIQKGVHLKITSLLEKTTDKKIVVQFFERFRSYVNTHLQTESIADAEYLKGLLKVCKSFFPDNYRQISDHIEKNISVELAHKLWLDGFIETCQINFVASIILSTTLQIKRIIFGRCSKEDKSNIFFKVLYSFENIDTESKLKVIKEFLEISKEFASEIHEKILNATINICTDYFKLNLWLEDYYETLDFNAYKFYTIMLSPSDQKKFVKKVLKYIHEGKTDISVEELTSLNVFDFETSKLAEQIDESHLDYSTSIILNVIAELKNQTNLEIRKEASSAQHRIYDLIIKQIKEPKDILQISGYFDECEGRCSVSIHEVKNEAGEVIDRNINYNRNERYKAKNHPICDGRKALNKVTKEPLLSDEKVEYWWCANQKCFKPTRELHKSSDWEKYSLLDFLTILNVDFKESDLEIYLNIINKANRFLKHLKCRECNHILYPKGKSQYAFYGVNNFSCRTETCSEKGKEIYLSHCLNGYCEMEIDSRDCVKCKPKEFDSESCGWYVCNYCHSCCSGQQLERRKWIYDNILHTEYKCHLKGHRELGIISCNKCGDSMESNEINIEEYERILNWFMINKDKSKHVHKSGKNKLDKWWFVIKRGNDTYESFREKLNKYHKVGFQIPDFEQDKDLQLISEPIDFKKHKGEILTCRTCGNILDLSNDLEKARAVKQFHNVRFLKVAVE
ncbi:cold shock domain-containing protein [Ginsengibacter hankyongi]|uniref:Cold shock domain-containing protein n=1 Tax=Ginsengibacter hankyongi TaxID=2607284 RepID=A0A5J5IEE9_9BACT|nr:cold shock domain-containing protein [Ginsengibacter hankyongi]KAA9037163.1 cold shock domain-containing protein [Ginsengibacter hankyongi]